MPEYAVPPQCIKVTRLCWLWPSVLPGHRLQGLSADKTMSAGHKTERNVTSSSERADSGDRVSSSSGADIEEDSLLFLYVARLDVWVSVWKVFRSRGTTENTSCVGEVWFFYIYNEKKSAIIYSFYTVYHRWVIGETGGVLVDEHESCWSGLFLFKLNRAKSLVLEWKFETKQMNLF